MTNKEKIEKFQTEYQKFVSKKNDTIKKNNLLLESTQDKKELVENEKKELEEQYISTIAGNKSISDDEGEELFKDISNKEKELELLQKSINLINKFDVKKDSTMQEAAVELNNIYTEAIKAIDSEMESLSEAIPQYIDELVEACNYYRELQLMYRAAILKICNVAEFLSNTDEHISLIGSDGNGLINKPANSFMLYLDSDYSNNFSSKHHRTILEKLKELDNIKEIVARVWLSSSKSRPND